MPTNLDLKISATTPLLLRRARRAPDSSKLATATPDRLDPIASHFTVVTTQGNAPEMHDQQEDAHR